MNSRTTGCSPTGFAGLPPAGPVGVSLALNVSRDPSPARSSQRTELLVTDRSLGRLTRGGRFEKGKAHEIGPKNGRQKAKAPTTSTQVFKKRPTARVHYTLKPPVGGWTCYLTDFTQSVSGISSAASRHRRLSPGGLRVQRGAGVLLGTRVVVDAHLLRAPSGSWRSEP